MIMTAPCADVDATENDTSRFRVVVEDYAMGPTAASGRVLPATRKVLTAFAVLTLLAANQLLAVGSFTDRFFAWTISVRPTSAFLGAAYAAGFLLAILALRQDRWRDVRVPLVTVTVFTVLTLIPTVIHLHVFHLWHGEWGERLAAWVWLAIYLLVPVACLAVVVLQARQPAEVSPVARPMPRWLTGVLAAQGVVLFGVGAVLFFGAARVHHLPAEAMSFWPWRLMPLGAQVIGAWLLALAVATALVIRERDLDRLLVPAVTYAAFGVFQLLVAVRYWSEFRTDYAWGWLYVAVLLSIAVTGGYGCWAARRGGFTSR
jgi:hypothetical protein